MSTDVPVWFITGASSGFGQAISLEALRRGYKVIATARNVDALDDLKSKGAHTLAFDVTADQSAITPVVEQAAAVYGPFTHVINCAGYVLEGMVEEVSEKEALDVFNTNVFGAMKVANAALPVLRKSTTSHPKVIANFGSSGSWTSWPSSAVYCSTKWAVSGLTEGLAVEVAAFGIKAVIIEAGTFRTRFMDPKIGRRYASANLPEYAAMRGAINQAMDGAHSAQTGDVTKGAKVIVDVLTKTNLPDGQDIPTRLMLGSDMIATVESKCTRTTQLMKDWNSVIVSTDYST